VDGLAPETIAKQNRSRQSVVVGRQVLFLLGAGGKEQALASSTKATVGWAEKAGAETTRPPRAYQAEARGVG
jgi:hypothetical protein